MPGSTGRSPFPLHVLWLWKIAKSIFQAGYNPCAWANQKRLNMANHRERSRMKVDLTTCSVHLTKTLERWCLVQSACSLGAGGALAASWKLVRQVVTTKWHSHVISAPHVLSPPDGWTTMRGVRTTIHCTLDLSARHIPSLHCPRKNHWTSQGILYRFYDFVVCMYIWFVCRLCAIHAESKVVSTQNNRSRKQIVTPSCRYRKSQWLSDTTLRLWKCDSHDNL